MSDSRRPALLIVDVQDAIDDDRWGQRNNPDAEERIGELLAAWRRSNLPIFHVRHDSTDPGSPYRPGQPGNQFKPAVAPRPGEVVVPKSTNNAFIGTGLREMLDEAGCDGVVIAGVLTQNSVEATARMAGNLGYPTIVVADATAANDITDRRGHHWDADDVHELSLAIMDGEYARIADTAELLHDLAGR